MMNTYTMTKVPGYMNRFEIALNGQVYGWIQKIDTFTSKGSRWISSRDGGKRMYANQSDVLAGLFRDAGIKKVYEVRLIATV